jgi:hypothetical protein
MSASESVGIRNDSVKQTTNSNGTMSRQDCVKQTSTGSGTTSRHQCVTRKTKSNGAAIRHECVERTPKLDRSCAQLGRKGTRGCGTPTARGPLGFTRARGLSRSRERTSDRGRANTASGQGSCRGLKRRRSCCGGTKARIGRSEIMNGAGPGARFCFEKLRRLESIHEIRGWAGRGLRGARE